MECREVREHLVALLRDMLRPPQRADVEAHLEGCPGCRHELEEERALGRVLRTEVRRYQAPDLLRAWVRRALSRMTWREWIRRPGLAWAAACLVVVGGLLLLGRQRDPLTALIAEAVSSHQRLTVAGQEEWPPPMPREQVLPMVRDALRMPVRSVFVGDQELSLMAVKVSRLRSKRAVALVYKGADGGMITWLLFPGTEMVIPRENRMVIEQYRPYHMRMDSMNVLVWRQQDIGYSLVAEAEDQRMAELFLRIRKAL